MGDRPFWPFDDPPAVQGTDKEKLAKIRQVRDQIDERTQSQRRHDDGHNEPLVLARLAA